jgi:transposase
MPDSATQNMIMPTPRISEDLRIRIVEYYSKNPTATYKSTAELFGVGEASVNRFLRVFRETGGVSQPPPSPPPKNKVDLAWLRARVLADPNARLKDHAQAYLEEKGITVSIPCVYNAMVAIGMTHKKKEIFAKEQDSDRVRLLCKVFAEQIPNLDSKHLVFLDESGIRMGEIPRYGWAPSGKKAYGTASHSPWKTITMIGAIAIDGIRSLVDIEATTTSEVFRAFVDQHLVPSLRPGDIVIMDNLSAHKDKRAVEAIVRVGATVLYLPPYSPDRNPIEKFWSKIKTFTRRKITDTIDALNEAVAEAMNIVSTTDILGWMKCCGYQII